MAQVHALAGPLENVFVQRRASPHRNVRRGLSRAGEAGTHEDGQDFYEILRPTSFELWLSQEFAQSFRTVAVLRERLDDWVVSLRVQFRLRCAVDHLMTLPYVDENRVGLLGICAGGGYAVSAALTEHRFKAVATVVASDIGKAFRRAQPVEELRRMLEAVGRQRTIEARGGAQRRDPWIPDSLAEAETAGVTDPDTLAAVHFYRESPWRHVNSTNRLYFGGLGHILGFDAFGLVPELLTQPLQVIVGGRRGTTGQYEEGERLFELARGPKKFYVVDGAGHLRHVLQARVPGPSCPTPHGLLW